MGEPAPHYVVVYLFVYRPFYEYTSVLTNILTAAHIHQSAHMFIKKAGVCRFTIMKYTPGCVVASGILN